jgi:hypothetical protein
MNRFIGTSITITLNYNTSTSKTTSDTLHSLLDYESLLFHCDWLCSDLRVDHFFSFRCPLVNTPQLNTQLRLQSDWLLFYESLTTTSCLRTNDSNNDWLKIQLRLHLYLAANRIQNTTWKNLSAITCFTDEVDFLNWPNPSGRTGPGVDSASNRNEYQES